MYNISKIIFIIFVTYGCASLPGINEEPKEQKKSAVNTGYYTINDVSINIININDLNEDQIEDYNNSKVIEIEYSISQFSNIYNYKYITNTVYILVGNFHK